MPANRSKRIASRQAQLSGRARHVRTHGPSGIPGPIGPGGDGQPIAAASASRPDGSSSQAPVPVARGARPRTGYVMPPEAYFGREMRKIGIVIAFILVVLAALTIVLK
ncbi:MAG: hypothetical protein HY681_04860 [Chloroflexi bacterium]|nr:hypothetical protein [Chloroflexota bacterium]